MEHRIGLTYEQAKHQLQTQSEPSAHEPDWMVLVNEEHADTPVQVGSLKIPLWRAIRERKLFTVAGINPLAKKKLLASLPDADESSKSDKDREPELKIAATGEQ